MVGLHGRVLGSGLLAAGLIAAASGSAQQAPLPAAFDAYLGDETRLTASERDALLSGAPVTKLLNVDTRAEVAAFGAVWIKASPTAYVQQVKDIENFERGGAFRITKRISDPPRLDDFAALELPSDDLADLEHCRVDSCDFKLGADALQRMHAEVDWKKPTARADAEGLFRRLLLEYVTGYLMGGNTRLAVYRDKSRPTFVANEFRSMIASLPPLMAWPDLKRYLLDYPEATLPGSSEFLYWQETSFGLKPTIRISHLMIQQRAEETVVASKMLYASHYFWTALELRTLLPDPARGAGFWFITVNHSRSDGLGGFFGPLVRSRVRDETQKATIAILTATKAKLESGQVAR